jgi:soluble epoxide hydrolase/lipid-phosphate phosphatase
MIALQLTLLLATSVASALATELFNPYTYTKKFASCQGVERTSTPPEKIPLKLGYIDINPQAKKTLVLVHGWPSLWTTYREQIQHFGKDYRLILPELRGYGDSQHPRDLNSSNTMYDVSFSSWCPLAGAELTAQFVDDIVCILDNASPKVETGVCVGNDFGSQVCWEAGRSRPDRFVGIFNVGIPVSQ